MFSEFEIIPLDAEVHSSVIFIEPANFSKENVYIYCFNV